jgi:hypothetical protein
MIAVALRQHRTGIAVMAAFVVLTALVMYDSPLTTASTYGSLLWFSSYVPSVVSGVFAVFWAAPLLSREYDNRTHLFAWGQDVSPIRWLAGKVVVLAGAAVLLSVLVGYFAYGVVHHPLNDGMVYSLFEHFNWHPLVMVSHTLFGFTLGLAASAIIRRTLPAMGFTLVTFGGIRGVTTILRPYYITPTHVFQPFTPSGPTFPAPQGALVVDVGYADAAGNPMADPPACQIPHGDVAGCLKANGVAGVFEDFHTMDRIPALQLIESGGYLLLAAVLFVIAFAWARRGRRA